MKKLEIAKRLARRTGLSQAEAADSLDRAVHQILTNVRDGRDTRLPGLGKFHVGPDGRISFLPDTGRRARP